MKTTIYLDLDGVIVDCLMPAMKVHDAPISDLCEYPQAAGWDCVKACNILRDCHYGYRPDVPDISANEFWGKLDYEFWSTLPMCKGAAEFLAELEVVYGTENICLATSATLDPQCAAGKVKWIEENLPQFARQYFIGPKKHFLSYPGSILVDDRDQNCEEFVSVPRPAGKAVLVPRPWNKARGRMATPYQATLVGIDTLLYRWM